MKREEFQKRERIEDTKVGSGIKRPQDIEYRSEERGPFGHIRVNATVSPSASRDGVDDGLEPFALQRYVRSPGCSIEASDIHGEQVEARVRP